MSRLANNLNSSPVGPLSILITQAISLAAPDANIHKVPSENEVMPSGLGLLANGIMKVPG
ncbi:MAG: hypothetical protein ACI8X5_000254 [Planctomycetota bacterium]|jgi:hypothetical protein